jgi:hypothetical protein
MGAKSSFVTIFELILSNLAMAAAILSNLAMTAAILLANNDGGGTRDCG